MDSSIIENLDRLQDQHWLASSLKGQGDLSFKGTLRFSGEWRGEIKGGVGSHLFVLQGAKIFGSIDVDKITVEGRLEDIQLKAKHIHVLAGSFISGKIQSEKIAIDDGAILEAQLSPT